MKIAINTRLLIKGRIDGISRFTYETVKRMCIQHPEHEFYLLFDRHYDNEFIFADNVKPVVIPVQARHPFLWMIWFHYLLPRVLKSIQADVFVSTDGYALLNPNIPEVDVIHDLNFEHFPEHLPRLVRWYYRKYFPKYAQKATRIATVSEYSKQDIHQLYNVPLERIDVVYNGVSSSFTPLLDIGQQLVRQKYTNGEEFFVFVGTLHPRKNIENLFAAFALYKKATHLNTKLIIVGEAMFLSKGIQLAYDSNEFHNDIIFTGRVSDKEMNYIVGSALAMTYVPLFEGFGIPILEAFACNIPVITSNCTSMPEVAGNAALLCNPEEPQSIADAMTKLATNKELQTSLLEKEKIQIQKFSWDKTAERLWESIQKAIQ